MLIGLLCPLATGQDSRPGVAPRDLTQLSLEELMGIEVVSAARKEQKLTEAPAAIHVVTQQDLRRSGLRSIAEALRLVPGMNVAQIDSSRTAVSARGFNGQFANKLLVLMDGRPVYTPLFSGVYWDVQDTLLEDLDRIEVIRGPGGALWGANAVNGVVNVISRSAFDTLGGLAYAGAGNETRSELGVRYGARLGEDTAFRVYAKELDRGAGADAAGFDSADAWAVDRAGFRLDTRWAERDLLTLQGDIYHGTTGQRTTLPVATPPFVSQLDQRTDVGGGNVLGRWQSGHGTDQESTVQLCYDFTGRRDGDLIRERRQTVDLDAQHRFGDLGPMDLQLGVGYRLTWDDTDGSPTHFRDPDRTDEVLSGFVQDEIRLIDNCLSLTLGAKLEHNDYTGLEWQPDARLLWRPAEGHTLWAAASRAVRTPSRADTDLVADYAAMDSGTGLALVTVLSGNRGNVAETLDALDGGWRFRPHERFSLDVAAFRYDYDHLRSISLGTPFLDPTQPRLVLPASLVSGQSAESYGGELAANWSVSDEWRISGGYAFFRAQVQNHDPTAAPGQAAEGSSPRHTVHLRSSWNLGSAVEVDALSWYVDNLPYYDVGSYTRLDLRLAWRPRDNLCLSVSLQNLLDGHHAEFGRELYAVPTQPERAVFFLLTVRF